MSHLSKGLVTRNHELDNLFEAREIMMKQKPKSKKDDSVSDDEDDETIDDDGYRDLPTVGVSFCQEI